jgi:hydrophobic/amphiphilic exporter-1 (mainly G- bacteria), HAE1 family
MWADQVLRKRLENVRGVGSVTLVGARKREIRVELLPEAMEAMGISADQVITAVRGENQELPAGALRAIDRERVVQVQGRIERPQDFGRIVLTRRNGVPIHIDQVARVFDGPEEVESLALYNGQRILALDVQKAQGENTIEVIDGLNAVLAQMQAQGEVPKGMQLDVVRDSGRPIRVSVANVRQTLFEGALLTIGIVFLFLNSWRSTVITGLTLPIALIGTFLFMYAFGFTINMITLMALSLCVGLLIDDAIVVRENIVRHVQMGKSARQAALEGTQEIGLAVMATTLSIVAVFLPIGFMEGILGMFFHEFGVTIVAAVLISMFVSFTLDPMLSSVWHDPAIHREGERSGPPSWYERSIGRVTQAVENHTEALGRGYATVLRWALRHRLATVGVALGTLALSIVLLASGAVGSEFIPKADLSETYVSFYTPVGSSLEATEAKARQVEALVRELPEVRYTLSTINTGQAVGKIYATVFIRLVDREDRQRSQDELVEPLRQRLSQVAGITLTHVGMLDSMGGGKTLQFSVQGSDLGELQRHTNSLLGPLRQIPGLVDLDTSAKPQQPTVAVQVNRDSAAQLGLSVAGITSTLRNLVAGQTVGNWRASDALNIDVKVRLAAEARDTPADLQRLGLLAGTHADGSPRIVRLAQVAEVREASTANQINRRDMSREVEFTANVQGRSAGQVSAEVRRVLEQHAFPPGMRWRFGGATKSMNESIGYAASALGLAVIFIYMILASQFKSFIQPLALMSSLPLTLIGVVLALMAFRSTLNLFSIIGVVMLMGLVTKNAILLLDFAIRARAGEVHMHLGTEGDAPLSREDALLLAAKVRLRPILMTTLAMIFGMVPLAFALSEGSEQRAPMGQAVIGGVITASLLTLVVVPVIYCWLDDFTQWLRRHLHRPARTPS